MCTKFSGTFKMIRGVVEESVTGVHRLLISIETVCWDQVYIFVVL